MLESSRRYISSTEISVLGSSVKLSGSSQIALTDRLNKVLKKLKKENLIQPISVRHSNFIEGRGWFGEYLIKGVALWICCDRDQKVFIVLGGSAAYVDLSNFEATELEVRSGSNITTYLNAFSTLFRIPYKEGRLMYNESPEHINIFETIHGALGDGKYLKTEAFDGVPYSSEVLTSHVMLNYFKILKAKCMLSASSIIREMEYAAIVHADYVYDSINKDGYLENGDRFVLGSPIYIAQCSPINEATQRIRETQENRNNATTTSNKDEELIYRDLLIQSLDLALRENYDEAIRALDKAIKLSPKNSEAWYNKGLILDHQGKYDEAMQAYSKAIELNPQSEKAWKKICGKS